MLVAMSKYLGIKARKHQAKKPTLTMQLSTVAPNDSIHAHGLICNAGSTQCQESSTAPFVTDICKNPEPPRCKSTSGCTGNDRDYSRRVSTERGPMRWEE